ncbi:hypothetical protein GE09DRAFT_466861 [Coniochaeta sp. 2T2.1]|nr:hypothetical protein GE09DRAFT_466861 [Coniochaeta sp. 2T2.1]
MSASSSAIASVAAFPFVASAGASVIVTSSSASPLASMLSRTSMASPAAMVPDLRPRLVGVLAGGLLSASGDSTSLPLLGRARKVGIVESVGLGDASQVAQREGTVITQYGYMNPQPGTRSTNLRNVNTYLASHHVSQCRQKYWGNGLGS